MGWGIGFGEANFGLIIGDLPSLTKPIIWCS
jgi:hypothetical protein